MQKGRHNIKVQVQSFSDGWYTTNEKVVNIIKNIAESVVGEKLKLSVELGGTDGRYLIERMPVVQFGTLREDTNIHGKNEFVYLADLDVVKRFIKKLLTVQL